MDSVHYLGCGDGLRDVCKYKTYQTEKKFTLLYVQFVNYCKMNSQ